MSMRKTMSNEYWVIGFCGDEYEYRITKWCLMRESGLLRDEYKLLLWKNKCTLELWNDKYELGAIKWWVYGREFRVMEWWIWVRPMEL